MRVKWKCIWNVVKLYLLGLCGAIAILIGMIWAISLWLDSTPVPELNESAMNTTLYATTYGCGCGFSVMPIVPLVLIGIGSLGIIYLVYQDIKPCIIWEEK